MRIFNALVSNSWKVTFAEVSQYLTGGDRKSSPGGEYPGF